MAVLGVAVRGRRVAGVHRRLGHVELRLVGDVAQYARLRAGAEQRALRALEDLDALQVGGVDVEIAARQLRRLLVEVDRDVRERHRWSPTAWIADNRRSPRPRM